MLLGNKKWSDDRKKQIELEDELLTEAARKSNATRSRATIGLPFDTIYRYDVVDAYLVELARRYPSTVQVASAGRIFEGRDIKYLKISSTNFQDKTKPVVMMESLLHCREWVGLPATLCAIHKWVGLPATLCAIHKWVGLPATLCAIHKWVGLPATLCAIHKWVGLPATLCAIHKWVGLPATLCAIHKWVGLPATLCAIHKWVGLPATLCAIHKWVGLPATLCAIHKLVLALDASEPELLRDIDWTIMPIANPDGYEFTHSSSRFWRKNRATGYMIGNICMGVDLNRNFDMNFGAASSNSPCTDTFHGSGAFSEPETASIRDVILEHRHRLELFLDIHSFGSMILYGYGDGILPPNGLSIHVAGIRMAEGIDSVKWPSNPNYIVGNVASVLYAASGSAQDYAQSVGATLSYTYELPAYRNSATLYGFMVDPDFIEQAGYETWEGIKAGARYALENFRVRMRTSK